MVPHGIELSEEQRVEMRALRAEMRREHMEAIRDMLEIHDEMQEAMLAERPDPKRLRELHDRIAERHGDHFEAGIAIHNRMYDLLTEEQREQLRKRRR